MKRLPIAFILIFAVFSHGKDPSDTTLDILRQSPAKFYAAYNTYAEKYAGETAISEVEQRARDEHWKILSRYAKAMWEVYDCFEAGDSIFKFPGLLSHGNIRWDDDKKQYTISLGLRPFSPGDELGSAAIIFDINGKVLTKSKAKYAW